MFKSLFIILVFVQYAWASPTVSQYYFPVNQRYMMRMLDLYKERLEKYPFHLSFKLLKGEKLRIGIRLEQGFFDFERKWRDHTKTYVRSIHEPIVKIIRKYASNEFLSVFDPSLDLVFQVSLEQSPYGTYYGGKWKWKRGIY